MFCPLERCDRAAARSSFIVSKMTNIREHMIAAFSSPFLRALLRNSYRASPMYPKDLPYNVGVVLFPLLLVSGFSALMRVWRALAANRIAALLRNIGVASRSQKSRVKRPMSPSSSCPLFELCWTWYGSLRLLSAIFGDGKSCGGDNDDGVSWRDLEGGLLSTLFSFSSTRCSYPSQWPLNLMHLVQPGLASSHLTRRFLLYRQLGTRGLCFPPPSSTHLPAVCQSGACRYWYRGVHNLQVRHPVRTLGELVRVVFLRLARGKVMIPGCLLLLEGLQSTLDQCGRHGMGQKLTP